MSENWEIKGKNVMITGANSGIGKETAVELAKLGAKIIMVCRNEQRGKDAKQEIIERANSNEVELMIADLADQNSIRKFAHDFKQKYDKLNVLINNAGLILRERVLTSEGYEMTLAINHLGPFLLTNLLLDIIIVSAPSRIISVSSAAHKFSNLDLDNVNLENKFSSFRAYGNSKLANILFSQELARKLKGKGVTVNSLHPGGVKSNFAMDTYSKIGKSLYSIPRIFMISPQKGARTSVYLASSPDVANITGKYFSKSKIAKTSKVSQDEVLQKKFWNLSLKMVGLD